MKRFERLVVFVCVVMSLVLAAGSVLAQQDPGPRSGAANAGGPFSGLNGNEQSLFNQAKNHFVEVNSVSGTIAGEESQGLGPTFNGNSCAQCHAQPTVGGSSPGLSSPQNPVANPQVALAKLDHATNLVPSFITNNGPVREARFVRNPDGSLDGGVHGLFTIAGRTDAPGCTLEQPKFVLQLAFNNVVFRIPTPLFGLGLVEGTPDATLRANLATTQAARSQLGIGGSFNTSGNDGTITRFGWKAQNKSLLIFAGEAYNVEQGVANEAFPNERVAAPGCVFNATLEDNTPTDGSTGTASDEASDLLNFSLFMRLTDPPAPAPATSSTQDGAALFSSTGCALCHSPSLTTGNSIYTGMSNFTYSPFSDFALHHMGSGLADGVNQGAAGPDQFRTAPLWGIGQRLFFLHDGRTSDLLEAIEAHADCGGDSPHHRRRDFDRDHFEHFGDCRSEANGVIRNFNALGSAQQQDILIFLRSL